MATARKTGSAKFISFVNSRIGKQLSTVGISNGSKTHLRTVQSLCKIVRTKASKKVVASRIGKSYSYIFRAPITAVDFNRG